MLCWRQDCSQEPRCIRQVWFITGYSRWLSSTREIAFAFARNRTKACDVGINLNRPRPLSIVQVMTASPSLLESHSRLVTCNLQQARVLLRALEPTALVS